MEVEELLARLSEQGFSIAQTRAYVMSSSHIYAPIIGWLRTPPLQAALQTLDTVWLTEISRLLPELRNEVSNLPRPEPLQDRWQRQRLFEGLARAFLAIGKPIVLVLDDVQWCDTDTLEWLHFLLDTVSNVPLDPSHSRLPVLLLCGNRRHEVDEGHPLFQLRRAFLTAEKLTEIDLKPLDRDETIQMASLLHDGEIDAETNNALFAFTKGNPFFIIETLASQGWEAGVRHAVAQVDHHRINSDAAMVPTKIYVLIRGQLAGLTVLARRLADLAAVLGREFGFELLQQMTELGENEAMAGLDELWHRGFIRVREGRHYDFSHDRIRDVVYAEISPVQRPLLHLRVGRTLEAVQVSDQDSISGQIGFHYEQAGEWKAAVEHYQRAANASTALYAPDQTIYYLDKILTLLDRQPDNPDIQKQRFECLVAKVDAVVALGGWTSEVRKAAIDRAYALAIQLDDPLYQIQALQMLATFYIGQGYWNKAAAPNAKAMSLAQLAEDEEWLMKTRHATGIQLYRQGRFPEAALYFGAELEQPDFASLPSLLFALIHRSQISWMRGYPGRAWREASDAISMCDRMGFVAGRILTREFAAYMVQRSGNTETLRTLVAELSTLCETFGYPNTALGAHFLRAWLKVEDGAVSDGIAMMQDNFVQSKGIDNLAFLPYYLTLHAVALYRLGQVSRSLAALEQAGQVVDEYGDYEWLAEIVRLTGVMQQRLGRPLYTVEESYTSALNIARHQGAKMLELRAVVSLVRLQQQHGDIRHAHELLSETYEWFTEGFGTKDLKAARALLSELSPN